MSTSPIHLPANVGLINQLVIVGSDALEVVYDLIVVLAN
jgi:hypothetical protein